jgi:hypothetical protein
VNRSNWFALAALLAAGCLVVSPLDEVIDASGSGTGGATASGGAPGSGGSGGDPNPGKEQGAECLNLKDEDQDGKTDCRDLDCCDVEFCSLGVQCGGTQEMGALCENETDDDGDGRTDCGDETCCTEASCIVTPFCQYLIEERGQDCGDDEDNDGDGRTDCADPSCCYTPRCATERSCIGVVGETGTLCSNGRDDDLDGDSDCADVDCCTARRCSDSESCAGLELGEQCANSEDDDGDDLTDCEDPSCCASSACIELPQCFGLSEAGGQRCTNELDDDGDEKVDCEDESCCESPECAESEVCKAAALCAKRTPAASEVALVDDFQDGTYALFAAEDRTGSWFYVADDTRENISLSGAGPSGSNAAYFDPKAENAYVGFTFLAGDAGCPYDVSAWDGVSLFLASPGPVRVMLVVIPPGASCPTSGDCFELYTAEFESSDRVQTLAWGDFSDERENQLAESPLRLYGIYVQATAAVPDGRIWVDDVKFVKAP